jgi:ArsR family transcriptional regulator
MKKPSAGLQTLKAEFFGALAHPVRIRLLEVLAADGETSVQELQRRLDVDQPIVSQQLAKLRASGIVVSRKQGSSTLYAAADPRIGELLRVAKQILNRHLTGVSSLRRELAIDQRR